MNYPTEREKPEADVFIGQTAFLTTYSKLERAGLGCLNVG